MYQWREPAVQAAIVNAALVVIPPVVWFWYVDYTSAVVRPRPTTVWSSAVRALPVLLACGAIAPSSRGEPTSMHGRAACGRSVRTCRIVRASRTTLGGNEVMRVDQADAHEAFSPSPQDFTASSLRT